MSSVYVRGDAVANATSYELYEKVTTGDSVLVDVNLVAESDYKNDGFYRPAGTLGTSTAYAYTDLISVAECTQVTIHAYIKTVSVAPVVWFDANQEYISGETLTAEQAVGEFTATYDVPDGAVYAVFSKQDYASLDVAVTAKKYEVSNTEVSYNLLAAATAIDFEVSALGLGAGDHVLVVKAKAAGYTDSSYSNEVTYTV